MSYFKNVETKYVFAVVGLLIISVIVMLNYPRHNASISPFKSERPNAPATDHLNVNESFYAKYSVPLSYDFEFKNLYQMNHPVYAQVDPPTFRANKFYQTDGSSCKEPPMRKHMYKTMKKWIIFASKHQIVWWITFGTLLGSFRNQDMIPWDHDVDICISLETAKKLREIYKDAISIRLRISLRPGDYCAHEVGPKLDCYGKLTTNLADYCAVCRTFGRLFLGDKLNQPPRIQHFTDIFICDIREQKRFIFRSSYEVYIEDASADPEHMKPLPITSYFPMRLCKMLGLTLPCPNNPEDILESVYGPDYHKPPMKCSRGNWVDV